jgi:hypothetical protein
MNLKQAENQLETICHLSTGLYCVNQHQLSGTGLKLNQLQCKCGTFASKEVCGDTAAQYAESEKGIAFFSSKN